MFINAVTSWIIATKLVITITQIAIFLKFSFAFFAHSAPFVTIRNQFQMIRITAPVSQINTAHCK